MLMNARMAGLCETKSVRRAAAVDRSRVTSSTIRARMRSRMVTKVSLSDWGSSVTLSTASHPAARRKARSLASLALCEDDQGRGIGQLADGLDALGNGSGDQSPIDDHTVGVDAGQLLPYVLGRTEDVNNHVRLGQPFGKVATDRRVTGG